MDAVNSAVVNNHDDHMKLDEEVAFLVGKAFIGIRLARIHHYYCLS